MRLLKLGGSLLAAKLADDAVDSAIAASKARYVAVGVAAGLIIFQKGGEAKLHKGDTIDVEPKRNAQLESTWPITKISGRLVSHRKPLRSERPC